ncbi:hypothetical protein BH11VER1_BH11VER1_41200 [soil metagenome]
MPNQEMPSLAALLGAAASGTLPSAPPYALGKALHKALTSTGHLVERFLTACDTLRIKVQQEKLPELLPYFHDFDFTVSTVLESEGLIVCPLQLKGSALKLQPLLLSAQQASQVVSAWHRVQMDTPKTWPQPLEPPANANAPLWPALLHLRPLHSFWEQQLRLSHVESLLERVPPAWILDPAPLPPGAVIPKLQLASWEQIKPESHFTIQGASTDQHSIILDPTVPEQQWHNSIHQALQSFEQHPQVLSESLTSPEAILLGIYQRRNQRVDLIGGIALHQDTDAAWQLSRW